MDYRNGFGCRRGCCHVLMNPIVRIPLKPIGHSGFKSITRSGKYRSLRPAQSDQLV